MKPIEVGRNDILINNYLSSLTDSKNIVQTMIDKFNAIGFDEPLKPEELEQLINNTREFIHIKVDAIEVPELNGKKLSKGAYLQLIGIQHVTQRIEEIIALKKRLTTNLHNANTFVLKGGKLEENKKETKRFINSATTFAKTDKEKEAYNLLIDLRDAMNKLNQYHIKNGMGNIKPMSFQLSRFLYQQELNESYQIALKNYKALLNTVW